MTGNAGGATVNLRTDSLENLRNPYARGEGVFYLAVDAVDFRRLVQFASRLTSHDRLAR
jgi:hypothetical protein